MATFNPRAILAGNEPGAWSAPVPITYDQRDVLLYAVGIELIKRVAHYQNPSGR